MIDTLRKNAKHMAKRDDVPGIANSLNFAADEIERLRARVLDQEEKHGLALMEVDRLRKIEADPRVRRALDGLGPATSEESSNGKPGDD